MERHLIKRKGHKEVFDERKLYASVYASALNAHLSQEDSEDIAAQVTHRIETWLHDRKEINAKEIKNKVKSILDELNPEVALLYDTIMDVC